MTYCTIDDIKNIVPEADLVDLTDDSDTGSINENVVNSAIEDADSLINGYLRSRYTLPLDEVPNILKSISVELTRYNLYQRRAGANMPESLEKNYANRIKILKDIQAGSFSLGVEKPADDIKVSESEKFYCNKTASDRVFNSTLLDKF